MIVCNRLAHTDGLTWFLCRTSNPAVLHLLLSLAGHLEMSSPRYLTLRCLTTSPDLMTVYLKRCPLTFDPRPTHKWVASMELLSDVRNVFVWCVPVIVCALLYQVLTELPDISQLLAQCDISQPNHTHLTGCLVMCVPVVITRSMLSIGLQVQYVGEEGQIEYATYFYVLHSGNFSWYREVAIEICQVNDPCA